LLLLQGTYGLGLAEVWIEPKVAPWDLAAHKIILEEAGAKFFNFDGGASIYSGNAVGCAPGIEAAVREYLVRPMDIPCS
jgi:fructose-1,6-bisphosphatase/inositol monophosphatase family enzyme